MRESKGGGLSIEETASEKNQGRRQMAEMKCKVKKARGKAEKYRINHCTSKIHRGNDQL